MRRNAKWLMEQSKLAIDAAAGVRDYETEKLLLMLAKEYEREAKELAKTATVGAALNKLTRLVRQWNDH
jgi:hypothetical protein